MVKTRVRIWRDVGGRRWIEVGYCPDGEKGRIEVRVGEGGVED
jgi:hypothetical protein